MCLLVSTDIALASHVKDLGFETRHNAVRIFPSFHLCILIQCSWVLTKIAQRIKTFPVICRVCRHITGFTRSRQWFRWIQSIFLHIVLPFSQVYLPCKFRDKNLKSISHFLHTCYIPRSSHPQKRLRATSYNDGCWRNARTVTAVSGSRK